MILRQQGKRDARVHDPSSIIKAEGEYWLFATGPGIRSWHSADLKHWERGPRVFEQIPDWVMEVVPSQRGHFWAPDVLQVDGRYFLYYSVSSFGKNTSAIALATNATLDPADARYEWVDQGIVIQSGGEDDWNAIDPAVIRNEDGSLWMAFGSFWSGIKLVQLDPVTGLLLDPTTPLRSLAEQREIEAPALVAHDDFYYLLVNWGLCCRGTNSTYNIRVGRSRDITGPYVDRTGIDLRHGGGSLLLEGEDSFVGPGHASVFQEDGRFWLSCHFYDGTDGGRSWLALQLLTWDGEGWPSVGDAYTGARLAGEPVRGEARPWARWWWLGSAVDATNLTLRLTQYRDAGFGGVEICPIYGVHGWEERQLPFLSVAWMEMLTHTMCEAERLGLGVDLTTGTGWPFGGPWVDLNDASAKAVLKRFELQSGAEVDVELPRGEVACAWAVEAKGEQRDLTDHLREGRMDWEIPAGEQWRLYVIVRQAPAQRVKRAAPGGEGSVLDPYSVGALERYLGRFDQAFEDYTGPMPAAHFHDSFEYFGAQWTPALFEEFQRQRGYDLRQQLPALFGEGSLDQVGRVKCDYRETLAAMHRDYLHAWTRWAHGYGSLTRNQAHGGPANWIDLYATVDIPETEIFGATEEKYFPMQKFASSAAHVMGYRQVSAEAFTWLNEHFQTSLADLKQAADYLFLSGVNRLVYHGIPYSPIEAEWPGWQFYAAVNFGPDGGLWRDLPTFNAYVTRCQTALQAGEPANDILLYFPYFDLAQDPEGLLRTYTVHNADRWLEPYPFQATATALLRRGYGYDAISDRLMADCTAVDGAVVTPGGTACQVILVPRTTFMPETTLRRLIDLAREGATVLMLESLPRDVPGWGRLEERRQAFRAALGGLSFGESVDGVRQARVGQGRVLLGEELEDLLQVARVAREPMVDQGLRYVRRRLEQGYGYFVANRGTREVDGYVPLGVPAESILLTDPTDGNRTGWARSRRSGDGKCEVLLQLLPGESCLLRTSNRIAESSSDWPYRWEMAAPIPLSGRWQVEFVEGGPSLPSGFETEELASWTGGDDPAAQSFSGTARYTLEFMAPQQQAPDWWLDLGAVHESAWVHLNGQSLGTLWSPPFRVLLGARLHSGRNQLEVEVTNLPANRIADLDRRKVRWKYFYDANVVNKAYRPFDASDWPPFDSGLLGPVTLVPLAVETEEPLKSVNERLAVSGER